MDVLKAPVQARNVLDRRNDLWHFTKRFLDIHMADCHSARGRYIPVLIPGIEEDVTQDFNEILKINPHGFINLFMCRQETLISPSMMIGLDHLWKESNEVIKEANSISKSETEEKKLQKKAEILQFSQISNLL